MSEEEFDVVVIGGGITGAGCALDAATRGYSVALIEREDYASGTSSRSSKLVHGGLRYLQNFDLGLVREALVERQLMVALAPHLVKPLKLVVPAFDGKRPDLLLGMALNMYDAMSITKAPVPLWRRSTRDDDELFTPFEEWSPERHRTIPGEEVCDLLPALAGRNPTAGYLFYDCQTDDVRLVLTVLEEAGRFGTVNANRVEALELLDSNGRAEGVRARDLVSGNEFDLRAKNVINATGVWADQIRPEELHDVAEVPVIKPSRGTHITFSYEDLPLDAGAIVPAGGGRRIFALPWLGRSLIGTTDNDYEGDINEVQASDDDVDYLLDAVNDFFGTSLRSSNITGAYAGVRPLISTGDSKKSVDISRKEELYETANGMVTITGGKLTTWRRMAKLAVDRLVERSGKQAPCRTAEVPLGMAIGADELDAEAVGSHASREHLASRYGFQAHEVVRIAAERQELAQPIEAGHPDLVAEAVYAARNEHATNVGDVLMRRTRLGLLAARELTAEGAEGPKRVGAALAKELDWSEAQQSKSVADFAAEAVRERICVDSPATEAQTAA